MATTTEQAHKYDVCLSFAGEQREFVEETAARLMSRGIRVFYDDYEQVALWGKDLYEHLDWIYSKAARYCVLFASEDYAKKVWTNHERKSAQARALKANDEYVLPARFDDTEIPGLRPTVGFVDLRRLSPEELAALIAQKLGPREHADFFPPNPDLLYQALDLDDIDEQEAARSIALAFMHTLRRMDVDERRLLANIFSAGCRSKLPENVHIDVDLMRRETGLPPAEIYERLTGMRSLGISTSIAEDHDGDEVITVEWHNHYTYDDELTEEMTHERSTEIAVAMLTIANGFCTDCARNQVEILDFSSLSSASA